MSDKRKIYGVEITKISQVTVWVKADTDQEALDWVNEDVNYFDLDDVETTTKISGHVDESWEVGSEEVYDSKAE